MVLWLIGQAGILLEVLGLLWVMHRAFRSEKESGDLNDLHTYGGRSAANYRVSSKNNGADSRSSLLA